MKSPQSTLKNEVPRQARVLVVGLGGLGCPLLLALKDQAQLSFVLCDDDQVDTTNLHRQILFNDADVGTDKSAAAERWLLSHGVPSSRIEVRPGRLLPHNARQWISSVDLVLEGADNFATKFLAADAAYLVGKPIVHGAAVTWQATAWCVAPQGRPCYRCLFEDIPRAAAPNCESAGVIGPVVGFAASLMAELALQCLAGATPYAAIHCYDGRTDKLRQVSVRPRHDCPLCGVQSVRDVQHQDYGGEAS